MKPRFGIILLLLMGGLLSIGPLHGKLHAAVERPATSYLKGLTWFGQSAFRLERGNVVLYLDPWKEPKEAHDADLVFITHPHFDHLDPTDVAKVIKKDTIIVTVADCVAKLKEADLGVTIREVKPGDTLSLKGVKISVVPAYNINKKFHPKQSQWAGFILEIDGDRIYHAGDTDFIPEMRSFKVDVALVPVSGTYVMTAEEAARAVKVINPKVAVPMHYGAVVGTVSDAKKLQTLCSTQIIEILPQEKEKQEKGP